MRLDVLGIDRDRPLKLLDRVVPLPAILVQQPEVVVHFGARVVLLEQRAVVRERVVEVADALIVEREAEMILGRRRRRELAALADGDRRPSPALRPWQRVAGGESDRSPRERLRAGRVARGGADEPVAVEPTASCVVTGRGGTGRSTVLARAATDVAVGAGDRRVRSAARRQAAVRLSATDARLASWRASASTDAVRSGPVVFVLPRGRL